jgi:uncharacterized protein with HEPN domain
VRSDRELLVDIRTAIDILIRYTPKDRTAFDNDLPIQSLMLRYIQIVGEAAWRISDSVKTAHPQIPWRRIAAIRHVVVHDYFRVDLNQVWNVATIHIPVLQPQIDAVIASLPPAVP